VNPKFEKPKSAPRAISHALGAVSPIYNDMDDQEFVVAMENLVLQEKRRSKFERGFLRAFGRDPDFVDISGYEITRMLMIIGNNERPAFELEQQYKIPREKVIDMVSRARAAVGPDETGA